MSTTERERLMRLLEHALLIGDRAAATILRARLGLR